jgi:hypothetical protein
LAGKSIDKSAERPQTPLNKDSALSNKKGLLTPEKEDSENYTDPEDDSPEKKEADKE